MNTRNTNTDNNVISIIEVTVEKSRNLNLEEAAEFLNMDLVSFKWLLSEKRIPYHIVNDIISFNESELFYWYYSYFIPTSLFADESLDIFAN